MEPAGVVVLSRMVVPSLSGIAGCEDRGTSPVVAGVLEAVWSRWPGLLMFIGGLTRVLGGCLFREHVADGGAGQGRGRFQVSGLASHRSMRMSLDLPRRRMVAWFPPAGSLGPPGGI